MTALCVMLQCASVQHEDAEERLNEAIVKTAVCALMSQSPTQWLNPTEVNHFIYKILFVGDSFVKSINLMTCNWFRGELELSCLLARSYRAHNRT